MVGQPGVVRGTQEEELGGVGHHVPILVHPGDAGRRVGLHQHKEHQEEPSTLILLVASICPQDLRLIWAANTGNETGGRERGSTAGSRLCLARAGGLVSHVCTGPMRCRPATAAMDAGHCPALAGQQPRALSPHLWPEQGRCRRPYTARRGGRRHCRSCQRPGLSGSS